MNHKRWTKEEEKFLKEHYSDDYVFLCKSLGRSHSAVKTKLYELNLRRTKSGSVPKIVEPTEQMTYNRSDMINALRLEGYSVERPKMKTDEEFRLPLVKPTGKIKFGIVSDSHLGSKFQQLTHLNTFYQVCEKQGITMIVHAGDVCEGNGKLYRGQSYEMFLFGADAQREYICKNYPKYKGVKTYMIGGSHDYSFFKTEGYDILDAIAQRREDLVYLGNAGAYLHINGLKIYLHHPSGGVPYARSYRLQKLIEQIAPENKPHILISGHLHIPAYIPGYRNVEGFQVGCFQSQTPYLKAKGLFPWIAGLIVEVETDKKGIRSIQSRWYPYYVPLKNDF